MSKSISKDALDSSISKLNFWYKELLANRSCEYAKPIDLSDGSKVIFHRENNMVRLMLFAEIPAEDQKLIEEFYSEMG